MSRWRTRSWILGALGWVGWVAAGCVEVQNTGAARRGDAFFNRDFTAFVLSESYDSDLNGDGDGDDDVVHVYDARTGVTTNLGLASLPSDLQRRSDAYMVFEDGVLAFIADESRQGEDLNGDGDLRDDVLFVYDTNDETLSNLGAVVFPYARQGFFVEGGFVIYIVSEDGIDFNGDNDVDDVMWRTYSLASRNTRTSSIASASWGMLAPRRPIGFGKMGVEVVEADQAADLNGDGDEDDVVAHILDLETGSAVNLGLAGGAFEVWEQHVVFVVSENQQGLTDLNNDGDVKDSVFHVYDSSTQVTQNLGVAWSNGDLDDNVSVEGSVLSLRTSEWGMYVYDFETSTGVGLGVEPSAFLQRHERGNTDSPFLIDSSLGLVTFTVGEMGVDLNGNGLIYDDLLHVHEIGTGTTTNVGVALVGALASGDGRYTFFLRAEWDEDFNGDGDLADNVLHVYDAQTNVLTNVGLACLEKFEARGAIVAASVHESAQGGTDLDGDGDANDVVLTFYDAFLHRFVQADPLKIGDFPMTISGDRIGFAVLEDGVDLNGDRDGLDEVWHVGVIKSPGIFR